MADSLNIAVIFLTINLFCNGETAKQKIPKLTIVSIDQCNLSNKRVDTANEVKYSVQARKVSRQTTVLKTSFIVSKKFGPITFTLVGYQLQRNNVRDLVLKMERMKCNNLVPLEFVKILTIKFDNECNVLPTMSLWGSDVRKFYKEFITRLFSSGDPRACSNLGQRINLPQYTSPMNKYEVDNIDIQDQVTLFQQFLSGTGKYAFDLEFWTPKGVVACVSFAVNFVSG